MTTLTAGASASITLTAGNQISGVGAGTAVIGRAGTVQALTAGDAWRIGPYLTAQTVSITATSAMVYEQVAQVSADPSPADLGLTAAQVSATAALVSGAGSRARMVNQIQQAGRALQTQSWGNSWENSSALWSAFITASGGKLAWYDEQGNSGERSFEVLARLRATTLPTAVEVVCFGEGTNDATSGITVADHISYMKQIAQHLMGLGMVTIMRLTPPLTANAPAQALTHAYWLAEIVLADQLGIIAVDVANRYVATDGQIVAAANDGTNLHLTTPAYGQCGVDGWAELAGGLPVRLIPRTAAGQGVRQANVLQLTDTNADGIPDGWGTFHGGSMTVTPSALADYAYPYRGKRATVNLQFASGSTGYINCSNVNMAQEGKTVRVAGVVKMAVNVGGYAAGVVEVLTYTAASALTGTFRVATLTQTTGDLYCETDFVVPAGTTKFTLTFRTAAVGGAANVTYEFGCWDVYSISDNTF